MATEPFVFLTNSAGTDNAVGEDARAQAAASATLEEVLRAGSNRAIHPVTGTAVLGAVKANTLDFKFFSDQSHEVHASRYDISARGPGRAVSDVKRSAKRLKDFEGKESNLSLIIFAMIKVAITLDSMSRDALDLRHFDRGMLVRYTIMVPDKIVARRDIEMTDFHSRNDITSRAIVIRSLVTL